MWNESDPPRPETDAEQQAARPQADPHSEQNQPEEPDDMLDALFSPTQAKPAPEPEDAPGPGGRKRLMAVLSLLAAAILVAITCLSIFQGPYLSSMLQRVFRYTGDETIFSFDAHSSNSFVSFNRGLAVASTEGLQCFDVDGSQTAMVQNQMDPPVALQNGAVAMSFGVGGDTITTVHRRKGAQTPLSVDGAIIDADLSRDSCICYSAVETGYKTVLAVHDATGREIYRWYSSTQYFGSCAVSEGGERLCAIAYGMDGTSFDASAVVFATDQEEPLASLSLGSDVVYDLTFVEPRRVCAVGESALHFFDTDATHDSRYEYGGGDLLTYALGGNNFTALVLDTNQVGSRFHIVTVGSDGTQLASLSSDEEVRDISVNGNYLAVLTGQSLTVYDRKLHPCFTRSDVGYAAKVCVQADGAALLIEGNTARRVS